MREAEESHFLRHTSCPACGSSDANSLYSDGHTHCFKCSHYSPGDGASATRRTPRMGVDMLDGEVRSLPKRGISEATCQKFGYKIGTHKGRTVQIADYRDADGQIVAQHVRDADKNFSWVGEASKAGLWGKGLWRDGGRRVVVSEGECDALAISQSFGNSWPVVSLPNGAQSAKKAILKDLEWLLKHESVVLWFDDDEPGRAAASECAALFPPGLCKIARGPTKDANDLLLKSGVKAVCQAVYDAPSWRPDGIVGLDEIEEEFKTPPVTGQPFPWPTLNAAVRGRCKGELWIIAGGTGTGKSDMVSDIIANDLRGGLVCGLLSLEQSAADSARRIAGKLVGKRLHVPDSPTYQADLAAAWKVLKDTGTIHMFRNEGAIDWATIEGKMRYMVQSLGVQCIFLDNLTGICAAAVDERLELDRMMPSLASIAKDLGCIVHVVSHLTSPGDGKTPEEGGRVTLKQLRGSRSIGFWATHILAIERNTQADREEDRSVSTIRVLKDRRSGDATGTTVRLAYDRETGLSHEATASPHFGGTDATTDF